MERLKLPKPVPRTPFRVSDMAMTRVKQMMARPAVTAKSPFKLPDFPKAAVPDKDSMMAMDDSLMWADGQWNTGSFSAAMVSSAFQEGLAFPGYAYLSEQAQRPEYRRFAEILATEMTRKWIKLQSVGDDDKTAQIKELEDAQDKFKLRDKFSKCCELDALFGRAHLYIDTFGPNGLSNTNNRDELKTSIGNGRDEFSRSKIGKGMLRGFRTIEPVWCYPLNYDSSDPMADNWYEPDTWFVLGKAVHASRCLKFVGREVPDLLKPAYSFGGLSMTQMTTPYVNNWLRTRQSVADIINSFSVFHLATDLGAELSPSEDGNELIKRADFFNLFRNNKGLMLTNKETEEFNNIAAPLGSLDALQAQTQEHMAAVAGIPIVKLLGIQPSGLNASSEGEIRTFYDWVAAFQEKLFRINLTKCLDFIQLHLWGEVDQTIIYAFEPLWSLDEKAIAEVRKVEADTDMVYVDGGVLHPSEVRQRVAADPESAYSSIDVEDVPDLKQEEEQGLMPKGAKGMTNGSGETGEEGERGFGDGDDEEDTDLDAEFEGTNLELAEAALKEQARRKSERERTNAGLGVQPVQRGVRGKAVVEQGELGTTGTSRPGNAETYDPGASEGRAGESAIKQSERNRLTASAALVRHERRNGAALDEAQEEVDEDWEDDDTDEMWEMGEDDFVESEHPRDASGKFSKYNVGFNLKQSLEKHGFKKKSKSSQGKYKFENGWGDTIVAEPPTHGGMQTSKWTLYMKGGDVIKGETGKNLTKEYQKLVGTAPEETKETVKELQEMKPPEPPKPAPKQKLEPWEKEKALSELNSAMGGLAITSLLDVEQAKKYNKKFESTVKHYGMTDQDVFDLMQGTAPEPEPKKSEPVAATTAKLSDTLHKNGFAPSTTKLSSAGLVWEKGNATVKWLPDGSWLSMSPGHYTKEGKGSEDLEKLLKDGKIGVSVKNNKGATLENWPQAKSPQQQAKAKEPESFTKYSGGVQAKMDALVAQFDKPSAKQKAAIASYTSSGYEAINSTLRKGGMLDGHAKEIQEYLTSQEFPEDVTVYRKVSGDFAKVLKSIMFEGGAFQDRGFSSTALTPDVWYGDIHFEIKVKKGQKGAPIQHLSHHKSEMELLLPAGARYKVVKIQGHQVQLEYLDIG